MADGDLFFELTPGPPPVSPIAERLYDLLLPVARQHDPTDGWPVLRLCAALTVGEQPLWELAEYPGMSQHLQVDVAPVEWLPWLAAVVGGRLTKSMSEAQRRLEITHPSGHERGRTDTITAMVRGMLTGQRLLIYREMDGGAYRLTVRTRLRETPDPAAVRAALLANIPGGIRLVDYQAVDERDWAEVATTWAAWTDIEAGALDWNDVNVP